MKKKIKFQIKNYSIIKKIDKIFEKSEIFFCKIIKNIFFENKKFKFELILIDDFN